MRLLFILILAASAWAACPTSDGYTSTCFVATTGNDTTGTGAISAPFATLQKAEDTVAAGDTIMVRAGVYSQYVSIDTSGTADSPITLRNFPGEVVIVDTSGVGTFPALGCTFNATPGLDARAGHWIISGIYFRDLTGNTKQVLFCQSQNDGFKLRGVRIYDADSAFRMSNANGFEISGSTIEAGTGYDCNPILSHDGYRGCWDVVIQDTAWRKLGTNNNDLLSQENGKRLLLERSTFYGSTTGGTSSDTVDFKALDVTVNRITATKGRNVFKTWGSSAIRNARIHDGQSVPFVLIGAMQRTFAGAVDDGDYIRITATYISGMGTTPGMRVTISGVGGCTGANGTFEVYDATTRDSFRIAAVGGGATSCGGTYTSGGTIQLAPVDASFSYVTLYGQTNIAYNSFVAHRLTATKNNISNPVTQNMCGSSYMDRVNVNDNLYYSGGGSVYAICYLRDHACGGCDGGQLGDVEPLTVFSDPNFLDFSSFRASATSPAGFSNRGYYAGHNEVVGVSSTAAIVRNLFPSASETVTATVSINSDFSSPVEELTVAEKGFWRSVVFGKSTPLTPGTPYHYKLQCGYDVVTGTFETPSAVGGTETLSVSVTAPSGLAVADAVLETSADGSSWTPESPVACASSCTLTASVVKDAVYYYRWKFRDAGAAVLSASQAQVVALP